MPSINANYEQSNNPANGNGHAWGKEHKGETWKHPTQGLRRWQELPHLVTDPPRWGWARLSRWWASSAP